MHDHDPSGRLASYADVLADQLPGTWTTTHLPTKDDRDDLTYLADLEELAECIWDLDLAAASLAEQPLQQAAVLSRPDGAQLALLDRHDTDDGFLIAAVAPRALPDEAYRAVREPNAIALSGDPFLDAEQVTGDLLVRYDAALAEVRHNAVGGTQPSQPDRLVLTWQPDGSIATAPVGDTAGPVLTEAGFVQDPHTGIYSLAADDTRAQARALRAIGPQLDALGITTALQHPTGRKAPSPGPSTSPAPAHAAARSSRAR